MSDINIPNAQVTVAAKTWRIPKSGESYPAARMTIQAASVPRDVEDRIGYHAASGHLINVALTFGTDSIEIARVNAKVSSKIESIGDANPVRITTITCAWNDEWGELDNIGADYLGMIVTATVTFLQGELPMMSGDDSNPVISYEMVDEETGELIGASGSS